MRSISQKVLIAVLVLVGIILLWWIGSAAYSGWQGYRWQKQTDAFQESLRRPYREDTFGGKTPEETWALFLSALRARDVELASKYFVVERQEEWKETLAGLKADGLMEQSLRNFSTFELEKGMENNKAYYHIKMPFAQSQTENIFSPVVFTINTYTKIWKISVL